MSPLAIPPPTFDKGTGMPEEAAMGTGTSVPMGLEAIFEYNGLFLNNRSWVDTYIISSIGGLDDADIRDDREVNPQDHGETAFDAYYGGRTITLSGHIRAFTLDKMRDMWEALKYAFADISEEKPLFFHSVRDAARDHLIFCKKNAPIAMTDEQNDSYFKRNFMITLRASNIRFLSLYDSQSVFNLGEVDRFDYDSMDSYTKPVGSGTLSVSSGKLVPSSTAAKLYVRSDMDVFAADQEVVQRYEPDSTFTNSSVRGVVRYLNSSNYLIGLVGADGVVRIAKVDGGTYSNLAAGGTVPARSSGNNYFLRVTCEGNVVTAKHYTEDPRVNPAAMATTATYTLAGSDAVKFGVGIAGQMGVYLTPGSTGWKYDDWSFTAINANSLSLGYVLNKGNFQAQPTTYLQGPFIDPILVNAANSTSLVVEGNVEYSNPLVINVPEDKMTDSSSPPQNKYNMLGAASDWGKIDSGDNLMLLTASGMKATTYLGQIVVPSVTMYHRDSWL